VWRPEVMPGFYVLGLCLLGVLQTTRLVSAQSWHFWHLLPRTPFVYLVVPNLASRLAQSSCSLSNITAFIKAYLCVNLVEPL
ncbi:hypothetical protein QBC32DRAFT_330217, partial [Pseudoneurospora amorphoporcata]